MIGHQRVSYCTSTGSSPYHILHMWPHGARTVLTLLCRHSALPDARFKSRSNSIGTALSRPHSCWPFQISQPFSNMAAFLASAVVCTAFQVHRCWREGQRLNDRTVFIKPHITLYLASTCWNEFIFMSSEQILSDVCFLNRVTWNATGCSTVALHLNSTKGPQHKHDESL